MFRPLLLLAFLLVPAAAHAQWTFAGPGMFYPTAVAENSDYVFFAATQSTGASAYGSYVYRSANGGRTWENTSAGLLTTQKPLGPSITALGAGDGLVVAAARQAYNVAHIYLSTDNGASWTLKTNFPTVYEGGVRKLYVLDANTIVAYAITGSSQAKFVISTDGGATWTVHPTVFSPVSSKPPVQANGVLAMYGGRRVNNKNESGIIVSTDLGATWTFKQTIPDFGVSPLIWADGDRIYYTSLSGTTVTLNWTADGGATWQAKGTSPGASVNINRIDAIISRGSTLLVKTLVTQRPRPGGGLESFNDDLMAYSTDFGDTWALGDPDSTLLRAQYNRNAVPEPPLGIVATKTGFLYANVTNYSIGNRLYYSADGIHWEPVNVNGFGVDMGNVVSFGGALVAFEDDLTRGGGGGFFRSEGGAAWRYVTKLSYSFNTTNVCAQNLAMGLAVTLGDKIVAVCQSDVYHSTDGLNFTKVGVGAVPTDRTKMLVEDGGVLYLMTWQSSLSGYGGQNGTLYTSADAGLTWTQGATDLRTLTRPSVAGQNVIFTDGVQASLSTDGGATFSHRTDLFGSTDAAVAATPTALFAGSGFERIFFGTYLNKRTFFRSTDGGANWQDLIADSIVADGPLSLHTDGDLLIGVFTDSVAVSQDDGQTWHGYADGWPVGVKGEDAFIHDGMLYVQVLFQGLYRAPLSSFGLVVATERDEAPAESSLAAWPSPARGDVQVRYTISHAQRFRIAVYDVLGRRVATLADGFAPRGTHTATWSESGLAAGLYVVRLTTEDGRSQTQSVVRL